MPWRPPGNRTPTPVETQICLPFIQRQIELADPDILVCVGGPSAAALLNMQGILKNRGRWVAYQTGTREIRAMRDAASGLSAALADRQAPRLARFAGDQEGAGLSRRSRINLNGKIRPRRIALARSAVAMSRPNGVDGF